MRKPNISSFDIKYYFYNHKTMIFSFIFCFLLGVIIGFVVVLSSDSYLNLLTSGDKTLYSIINGTASYGELFFKNLFSLLFSFFLIFLLSLNFYLGLLSFVFIIYQSAIFVMTMASLVSLYGLSGILNMIFVLFPINVLSIMILIFFSVTCLTRSLEAQKNHMFSYGISDSSFLTKILISMLSAVLLCFLSCVIYPLFLKSIVFLIF